jgi:hypothetical protein
MFLAGAATAAEHPLHPIPGVLGTIVAQQDKVADREPKRLAPFAVRPLHWQDRQQKRQQPREIRRQQEGNEQQPGRPPNAPPHLLDNGRDQCAYAGSRRRRISGLEHKLDPEGSISKG